MALDATKNKNIGTPLPNILGMKLENKDDKFHDRKKYLDKVILNNF